MIEIVGAAGPRSLGPSPDGVPPDAPPPGVRVVLVEGGGATAPGVMGGIGGRNPGAGVFGSCCGSVWAGTGKFALPGTDGNCGGGGASCCCAMRLLAGAVKAIDRGADATAGRGGDFAVSPAGVPSFRCEAGGEAGFADAGAGVGVEMCDELDAAAVELLVAWAYAGNTSEVAVTVASRQFRALVIMFMNTTSIPEPQLDGFSPIFPVVQIQHLLTAAIDGLNSHPSYTSVVPSLPR